jgi:hypothetical protein
MSNHTEKKRYPLHLHIASLFTILVLLIGITLAWVSYKQISDLTFETTEILFTKTIDELELQFQREYRPVATSVRLLSSAAISEASNLDDRMRHIPILAEVLRDEPQIAGFGIGYTNGDYFIMRPLNTTHLRTVFKAPEEAVFMIDHISHNEGGDNRQIRIFLTDHLEPVGESLFSQTSYDPRVRPWYRQAGASSDIQVTSPYLFFFTKKIGITLSRTSARGGSTVAADITLDNLSLILQKNRITPSTFSLIFNAEEEVLSHSTRAGSALDDMPTDSIPLLSELPEQLAERIRDLANRESDVVPFMYNDERWFGTVRNISTGNRLSIKLMIAAPERELLAAAFEVRKTSIMIIIGVVLLVLPIAWFIANQIASPLRKLAHDARGIADFNFDNELDVDSIVLEVDQLSSAMESMRITISNFFDLISSLSAESDINRLLDRVTDETMQASAAEAAVIYLLSDQETELIAQPIRLGNGSVLEAGVLATESLAGEVEGNSLLESFTSNKARVQVLQKEKHQEHHLSPLFEAMGSGKVTVVVLPLTNRNNEGTGLLCLLYGEQSHGMNTLSPEHIGFAQALSGFAKPTTVENAKRPAAILYRVDCQRHRRQIALYRGPLPAGAGADENACRCRLRQRGPSICQFFTFRRRVGRTAYRGLASRLRQGYHARVCCRQGDQAGDHLRSYPRDSHALRSFETRRRGRVLATTRRGRGA